MTKNDAKLLINDALRCVVRVNGAGSGVIIHNETDLMLILTNAHVVEGEVADEKRLDETPFILVDQYTYDGRGRLKGYFRSQAEIVAYDRANDLAVLRMRENELVGTLAHLPKTTFIDDLNIFEQVYVVGCSLGGFPVPSMGILSSLNAEYANKEYWMSTAPVVYGNSGGGCFAYDPKTKHFILIGIPTAIRILGDEAKDDKDDIITHLNYIIPAYRIEKFIEYVLDKLKNDVEDD